MCDCDVLFVFAALCVFVCIITTSAVAMALHVQSCLRTDGVLFGLCVCFGRMLIASAVAIALHVES